MGCRLAGWGIALCMVCETVELRRKEREDTVRRIWGWRIVVDLKYCVISVQEKNRKLD